MRNFQLLRLEDDTGISGTGVVAEGTEYSNGKVTLSWVTQYKSIGVYDSIHEVEVIHGHSGKTKIVFEGEVIPDTPLPEKTGIIVDVSKWQGELNWSVTNSKVDAAIMRAGSIDLAGYCYTDYQFKRNWQLCKVWKELYWYCRPQFDANKQADYLCSLINEVSDNGFPKRIYLDVEDSGGQSKDRIYTHLRGFERILKAVFPNIEVGCYTRASFWNGYVGKVWNVPLWIARYVNKPAPWGNPGDQSWLKPIGWDDWILWQWSADGNGRGEEFGTNPTQSKSIDINRAKPTYWEVTV